MNLPAFLKLLVVFCLSTVFASCEGKSAADEVDRQTLTSAAQQFVPDQAIEITQSDGLPWVQLNFKIAGDPVEVLFNDSQLTSARREGWRVCRPSSIGASTFEDRTVSPARMQSQTAAVLFRGDILIVIAALSDSPIESHENDDNETGRSAVAQQMMVIARHADVSEAEETAISLAATCE